MSLGQLYTQLIHMHKYKWPWVTYKQQCKLYDKFWFIVCWKMDSLKHLVQQMWSLYFEMSSIQWWASGMSLVRFRFVQIITAVPHYINQQTCKFIEGIRMWLVIGSHLFLKKGQLQTLSMHQGVFKLPACIYAMRSIIRKFINTVNHTVQISVKPLKNVETWWIQITTRKSSFP